MASILLVEDEAAIREMVAMALERAGYRVRHAESAEDGEAAMRLSQPDLVLLDWMLPGQSGIDFARRLKRERATRDIPIILLTARGEEADRIRGLDAGADDYVPKPFSPRELVARVKAVLRRVQPTNGDAPLESRDLRLDPVSHRVTESGRPIEMGPTEFRLLHFFMTHPDRVFNRAQLLDNVWGANIYVEERTVDVHVRRLRKALEPSGHHDLLQTVRGAGYRFSVE
ncbi:phosphate regulon transcriptional regulator PhoB [Spiribacter vilamensis]|uniref:Phosphate regulon transcriptional regulatory protein PhoB n=1 Tax=Spiribacter vilamensis TaxID=531306 RepID=A0A4Q8CYA8_9GAMM|nr:phosphate regulon transcriptional regulator PhoB [Spiribacter vilamensis]RZU97953.1 winged helix family two component transcriptional regulator [Spiribacter vilamensis]TVO61134.1 phosphate regulon transcriptional regulatory protein PhoB [Spiribacter vilamensis]